MIQGVSIDVMVLGLFAFCTTIILILMGFLAIMFYSQPLHPKPVYATTPLEQIHQGLNRLVEEADWLEGDKLNLAVRYVVHAREAVEQAAKVCGKSNNVALEIPAQLTHALDVNVEMLSGSSTVIAFHCDDCGQDLTAMLQFPKVGGRPETSDPVAISARSDWRDQGFSASTACKRCQKLLKKKFLYDKTAG